MTAIATTADSESGRAHRLKRLPLVLTLALGLLVSLIHCCGDAVAAPYDAAVTMTADTGPSSDTSGTSDQQMPVHAGHCLSHVRAETTAAVLSPDVLPRLMTFGNVRAPRIAATLPPFKPPRI